MSHEERGNLSSPEAEPVGRALASVNETTIDESWLSISQSLLRTGEPPIARAEIYKAWVRWLHRLTVSSDAGDAFLSGNYWMLLQQGLQPPSAEQRRYCLYILGKSISLLDQNINVPCFAFVAGDSVFIEAYEKYCTLFSTFVLDRYINQVEECLPELRDLAAPAGLVDPSWVITLLGAALHQGIQDSVRKAVGDHFMQWRILGFHECATWPHFLSQTFLPWACQGYLFTTSIIKSGSSTRCDHGDRLSMFVARLVHLCIDGHDVLSLATLLLRYIADTPKLFPYAGAYIIQGLYTSMHVLAGELHVKFGKGEIDLAARVLRRADLPEIGREAWRTALRGLCETNQADTATIPDALHTKGTSLEQDLESFRALHATAHNDVDVPAMTFSSVQEILTIPTKPRAAILVDLIKQTKSRCLQRDGLMRALAYMERCIAAHAADEHHCHSALLALWSETEVQDFPKAALTALSVIAFDESVLNKIHWEANETYANDDDPQGSLLPLTIQTEQSNLHALILEIWSTLLRLARGRIYVFASLTRALHKLCLSGHSGGGPFGREVHAEDYSTHIHYRDPPNRVIPFNDFVVQVATAPPRPKVEFQLEAAVAPMIDGAVPAMTTYMRYYGEPEGVAYAYVFDILNRVDFQQISMRHLIDRLLQPWLEQQQPLVIVSKWKHTVQLQFMLLLIHQMSGANLLTDYFKKFMTVLAIEPMPRYRFLLQWIIVTIYSKIEIASRSDDALQGLTEGFKDAILEPLRQVEHDNPKFVGSVLKIGLNICKMKGRTPSDFPLDFMTAMVAMCASPKIVVRHEAQWAFVALWDFSKANVDRGGGERQQWMKIVSNPVLQSLSEYMQRLDRYTNPPPERLLEEFDFNTDNHLTNLLQGDYLKIDPSDTPLVLREDFVRIWTSAGYEVDEQDDKVPRRPHDAEARLPWGKPTSIAKAQKVNSFVKHSKPAADTQSKAPMQTKAASWQTVLESLHETTLTTSIKRHVRPIIVFASHITSAVNLGGLSRASEVFGAQALIVAKEDVIKDKAFLGVSVQSHLHFAITEVKPDEPTVLTWLKERRKEGYGIVGVEQTDKSTVLGEKRGEHDALAFPKKCVLVMGSEREGIPGWLLAECDAGCVEIPQVGVTRSLNVQTAAAVALYEYGRQHG